MSSIYELLPDHEVLLNLEVDELAGIVLEYLHSFPSSKSNYLNFKYLTSPHILKEYPNEHHVQITRALMEAWTWLKNEGFIVPIPGSDIDHVCITKKGENVKDEGSLESYRKANLLPKKLMHPIIEQKVYHLFSRGDYDTAIFQAYKEVEVAVRDTGSYTEENEGTYKLMRKAFHPETGKLRDTNQTSDERQAASDLFAGAMGLYRNPHAHRNILVPAEEAVEIIMFASHLLRIVDSRVPTSNAL